MGHASGIQQVCYATSNSPWPHIMFSPSDQPIPVAASGSANHSANSSRKSVHSNSSSSTARLIHYGSDLFSYDQRTCANQILIGEDSSHSKVEYDEYVVYSKLGDEEEHKVPARGRRKRRHSDTHVTHRFSQDHVSGAKMVDLAFRQDHELDRNVCSLSICSCACRTQKSR